MSLTGDTLCHHVVTSQPRLAVRRQRPAAVVCVVMHSDGHVEDAWQPTCSHSGHDGGGPGAGHHVDSRDN
jgi:hypothetical protein